MTGSNEGISIELSANQAYFLYAFLCHAKFGDGPKEEITFHPLINELIEKLTAASPPQLVGRGYGDWGEYNTSEPLRYIWHLAKERSEKTGEDFESVLSVGVFPGTWNLNRPEV
jgi:hypothetical protein